MNPNSWLGYLRSGFDWNDDFGRPSYTKSLGMLLIGSIFALCIRHVYGSGFGKSSNEDDSTHTLDSKYRKEDKQEQIEINKHIKISILSPKNGIKNPIYFLKDDSNPKLDLINTIFFPLLRKIITYHKDLLGNHDKEPQLPDHYYDDSLLKGKICTENVIECIKENDKELLDRLGDSKNIPFDFILDKEKEICQFIYRGNISNENNMKLLSYHMDGFSKMILYLGISSISGDNLMTCLERINERLKSSYEDEEKETILPDSFDNTAKSEESDNVPDLPQPNSSTVKIFSNEVIHDKLNLTSDPTDQIVEHDID